MTCKVHNKEINSPCAELFVRPLYLYSKLMVPKSTELEKKSSKYLQTTGSQYP